LSSHQSSLLNKSDAESRPSPAQVKSSTINRQLLYEHWASWRCLFRFQPLDEIENYFGTRVAFFFAWLGFYTTWLLPMALLGVLIFFFGKLDPSYQEGMYMQTIIFLFFFFSSSKLNKIVN
jgi:hypothetical protein